MKNILSLLFVSLLLPLFLSAQTAVLNISLPERVTVCDSSLFSINVSNPSGADLTNLQITVELPGNLEYRPGTVSGGSEANISNLGLPVFALSDIASGQDQRIDFFVFADCDVFTAINSSVIFSAKITADFSGGNAEITSDPFPVETPFLVVTKTNPRLVSGSRGDIFQREIEIRNTRLGALRSFRFRDTHQSGIEINSLLGADENPDPIIYEHTLTGADFTTIGDNDDLFEFNESITVTENIIITSCGDDLSFAKSKIEVTWGCRNRFCQANETSGFVNIEENEKSPELVFEPMAVPPTTCFCGSSGEITQRIKITNTGDDSAVNITLVINQDTTKNTGILPGTFRMDSAGQVIVLDNVTPLSVSPANACSPSEQAFDQAIVRIAELKAGASVEVLWEAVFCQFLCDQTAFNRWTLETSYNTLCPPPDDRTIIEDFVVTSDQIQGDGNLEILSTIADPDGERSSISELRFWLKSQWLQQSGTLTLSMTVDNQIDLNNASFELGGVAPTNIDVIRNPLSLTFLLDYPLPFSDDSVAMEFSGQIFCDSIADLLPECMEEQVTTCVNPCTIPINPLPSFPVGIIAQYLIDDSCDPDCSPTVCVQNSIFPICPIDSICSEEIPGYIDFVFSSERENVGLIDNDDDRIADADAPADRSLIRLDRLIPGDTLITKLSGWVVGDDPNFSRTSGTASIQFSAVSPLDVSDANQFYFANGVEVIDAELEIFDASSGQRFTCSDLPFRRAILPNLVNFSFDLETFPLFSICGVPLDFAYEDGDSVSVSVRHRFLDNLNLPEGWTGNPPSLEFSSFTTMRLFDNEDDPEFFCRCSETLLQLSNYDFTLTPKNYGLDPCDVSDFSIGDVFTMALAERNFFPFEVRPLVKMNNYVVDPELPIDIREVIMSLNLQGSGNLYEDENLTFVKNGNAFEIDLLPFQDDPLLDEGFSISVKYKLDSDCSLDGIVEVDFTTDLSFLHDFPGVQTDFTLTEKLEAFNILAPDLRVTSLFPDITSNDRFARWDLNILNRFTNTGVFQSGDALNAFLYVNSQNNAFTDYSLVNVTTGDSIAAVNGVFQLGDLPPDENFPYQLIGESISCDNEKVTVHFGWNCEPVTDSLGASLVCFKNSVPLEVKILPGEIESILDTTRISGDLCDTLPFFTIEIFNAELGSLYDVFLETTLPPGLLVADGTSELAHPNSAAFTKIDDPENLGNGFYKWNFTDLNDSLAARGLPSVLSSPSNSLILRFRTITDCNFIAESFPTFNVGGFQNCEKASNSRARAAKPVSINGVSAPYGMGVSADDPIFGDCDDEAVLNFSLTPDAMPEDRDSILLNLPPGLTFVSGSYVGNANAPAADPIIENNGLRQTLKWIIDPTLQPGDRMELQVRVRGLLALACEREFIQLQSVATTSALCVATNENCDIRVQTGGLFIPIDINRPDLDLTNFTTEIISQNGNETVVFSIQVNNSSPGNPAPVIVRFYQDIDGDGMITGADILMHTDSLILTGASDVLSGSFSAKAEELCNLIAVVDADENCSCSGDILPLSGKIVRTFPGAIVTCSDAPITIGTDDVTGSNFQWIPTDDLSCTDCPRAEFVATNNSPVPLDFNFQLIENNAFGCLIENNFTVTVRPEPEILLQTDEVCLNDCIELETTDGTTAIWSGNGITDPNDPTPEVCPQVTTEFTAMVSDTFGCSASAKVTIEVLPLPSVDAGVDLEYCPGQSLQLNGMVGQGASPVWSPGTAVTNPGILNPSVVITDPTTITLTAISLDGCENSDDVFVDIISEVTLDISSDVTICEGTEATLTVSGATDLDWSPSDNLTCIDCPTITVMPDMTTTYTVTGSLNGFCESTAEVTVVVVIDTIKTSEELTICDGDSALIFNNFETEAGAYQSDPFSTAAGCDSVHVITLNVSEQPEFSIITTVPLCPGECDGQVTAISDDPQVVYNFDNRGFGPGNIFIDLCADNYEMVALSPDGCRSDTVLIELLDSPISGIEITPDTSIRLGDSVQLSLNFPPGIDQSTLTFDWSPADVLTCADCEDPIAFPEADLTEVSVVITNTDGCEITLRMNIRVTEQCLVDDFEIPNIFSPNGDDINDVFKPFSDTRGAVLDFVWIRVFNRWGEKVYEGRGADAGWDGNVKGERAVSDAYVYLIQLGCGEEVSEVFEGDVTLYR